LSSYHYYVGCGNEVHNVEDKLSEIALLQQGVEVRQKRLRHATDQEPGDRPDILIP
jgi:hypothetical protein